MTAWGTINTSCYASISTSFTRSAGERKEGLKRGRINALLTKLWGEMFAYVLSLTLLSSLSFFFLFLPPYFPLMLADVAKKLPQASRASASHIKCGCPSAHTDVPFFPSACHLMWIRTSAIIRCHYSFRGPGIVRKSRPFLWQRGAREREKRVKVVTAKQRRGNGSWGRLLPLLELLGRD